MKNKPVVIFGIGELSSLAWYCLTNDTERVVAAFTVDGAYINKETHEVLPVIPFEEIAKLYPPEKTAVLLPIGFTKINGLRKERYNQCLAMGYEAINYVSSRASVWPDHRFNGNCIVYEQAVIQPFAEIGENVIIRSNAHISHHCKIGNHCFIAAGATLGGCVTVGERCFIGLGAVIRDGLKIAERTFIGAGAVVVSDTEPDCVYVGNPARKTGKTSMEVTRTET